MGRTMYGSARFTNIVFLLFIFVVTVLSFVVLDKASAANFSSQTGYYVGNGSAGLSITGLGFQPDFVWIKSTTAAGAAVFKTSAMPANTTAFTTATANDTGSNITLDSDGFTLGTLANVNTSGVIYYWLAVGGSDCSATGNFCVGTYTGNNTNPRNINVGFVPTMAMVKTSGSLANFRVNSEPANETLFLDGTARNQTGAFIANFGANYFTVGATNNTNTVVYYYVSFKDTAGSFAQGTYAGNAAARSITGLGFKPSFLLVKNATGNNVANRTPYFNISESFGNNSSNIASVTANTTGQITSLDSDGFSVSAANPVNQSAATIYWFAVGPETAYSASGNFAMSSGTYTGNGTSQSVSGLGFKPDLVIIKGNGASLGVFRTSVMQGDSTAYFSNAVANFTGGITSIDADGFSVGNNATTNTNSTVYQWQAFGAAYNPYTNSGSTDFAVGAYYGNGIDSRDISRIPWQADMVTAKRNGATAGVWSSSAHSSDSSSFFAATADGINHVQAFNADGFQVGNSANVNTAANVYYWFAFKTGSNFAVNTYTGTGTAQSITTAGFRAEMAWVKRSTAVNGIQSAVTTGNNVTQYFVATANVADRITGWVKGGFSVGGNQTESNTNTGTYHYAAWNNSNYGTLGLDIVDASGNSVASPSYSLNNLAYNFSCAAVAGTLGTSTQRIRVSNFTAAPAWTVSIAATSGNTSLWRNVGDTEQYDFNDSAGTPNGCSDGADSDTKAGQLTVDASGSTIAAESGCNTTNVSGGSSSAFNQGLTDSITLLTASSGADADCYFDLTNVALSQRVPAEQPVGNYSINMTITVIAN